MTSAVIGFAFERLVRKESLAEIKSLFRDELQKHRVDYLAELPKAFVLDKKVLRDLVKEGKLDEIIQTALQSRYKKPSKKSVELKEWVFPKGGVAFVWSLEEEYNNLQQRLKQSQQSPKP